MKEIARFFKVLSDEARLQMLWLLWNHQELCVCDLMEVLGITQSKASRHLATLRHAGLVSDRKIGTWAYYSIRTPKDAFERKYLGILRASLPGHPSAARALKELQGWLKRKDRTGACEAGGARNPKGKP